MHKQLLNECRIGGQLATRSPLLVRAAVETIGGPEVGLVLTVRGGADEPYLPGSTLKGALRSQAERILRTLRADSACYPNDERGPLRSCGRRIEEREREAQRGDRRQTVPGNIVYRDSCAACKLFGSTALAGRVAVSDGYLAGDEPPALVRRDGIGIDRFSGAASLRSRYELEAVTDVTFAFSVTLTNFEVWQLALLGLALHDLVGGRLPLGSGKSRGLGAVAGALTSLELAYPRTSRAAGEPALLGVGALSEDGGRYGYRGDDRLALEGAATADEGIRRVVRLSEDATPWPALTDALVNYLEGQYRPSPWLSRDGEGESANGARLRQPAH